MASPLSPRADARTDPHPVTAWVVEDDERYRSAVEESLSPRVEVLRSFESVEQALRWAKGRRGSAPYGGWPDVILLDVSLPGMSGLDGIGKLKAQLPRSHVVMLTIYDDAGTIYDALRAGASGYVVKDAHAAEIVAAVEAAHAGGMAMPGPVARNVLAFFRQFKSPTHYGLTPREVEVLQKMVEGLIQKEIAAALDVSPYTVNTHVQHIYEKLHVHSGTAAVAKAVRERLVAGSGSADPTGVGG